MKDSELQSQVVAVAHAIARQLDRRRRVVTCDVFTDDEHALTHLQARIRFENGSAVFFSAPRVVWESLDTVIFAAKWAGLHLPAAGVAASYSLSEFNPQISNDDRVATRLPIQLPWNVLIGP